MIIVNTVKFRRPKITLAQCNNLTETINLLKKKKTETINIYFSEIYLVVDTEYQKNYAKHII